MPNTTYTANEVAEQMNVTPSTVRAWIRRGDLEASNVSTARRPRYAITPEALARFKLRQKPARNGRRYARHAQRWQRYKEPVKPPPPQTPTKGPITRKVILACLPERSRARITGASVDWLVLVCSSKRIEDFPDFECLRAAVLELRKASFIAPIPRGGRPAKRQGRLGRRVAQPPQDRTPNRICEPVVRGPHGEVLGPAIREVKKPATCRRAKPMQQPPSSAALWTEPGESKAEPWYRPTPDVCT